MIDDNAKLLDFIKTIKNDKVLAIDTEFLRIDTYYPKPCLIQIASDNTTGIIDLTVGLDLSPLFDSIFNKLLIFHSGRQDLEVLFNLSGKLPTKIFDSQIFANFLGYNNQISYGNLVKDILGISLDKAYSNYDWGKRPLPDEVWQYALDDVIYLIKLYHKFKYSKFYNFATEDASLLLNQDIYQSDINNAYKYLKGYGSLSDDELNLATRICAYREVLAIKNNKPRKWILADSEVLKMARSGVITEDIKKDLPDVPKVSAGINNPPTIDEKNQIKKQQKLFKKIATEYNLPSEIFASKKQILKFIRGNENVIFNQGWRKKLLQNLGDINE